MRITRGRIRVAVAPPTDLTKTNADLRRVSYMIAHALDETKRFQSPDPSVVQELLHLPEDAQRGTPRAAGERGRGRQDARGDRAGSCPS